MKNSINAFSLRNGNYMAVKNCMYTHMIIDGASGTIKDNAGSSIEAKITVGDFGAADPEVVKATGKEN